MTPEEADAEPCLFDGVCPLPGEVVTSEGLLCRGHADELAAELEEA